MAEIDFKLYYSPKMPARTDYGIGVIGAGFIVRDCHLVAYQQAGFNVVAIASRTPARAREVAELRGIGKAYDTYQELLKDPRVEVVDIAFPPDQQLGIIREIVKRKDRIKGILAQKPLAMDYTQAAETVHLCEAAGIKLAVNQNMRYDQSIRALKALLNRGYLGDPVLATIEMRAIPHWQTFLKAYDRLTFLNMSIHHLDCFRFLFGNPESVLASARTDPRTAFRHTDGITLYILEYAGGLRALSLDDVWAGPSDPGMKDTYIKWRVEGTQGLARGTIGWPDYPHGSPSTIDFTTRQNPGYWLQPRWTTCWFPDAFAGPMAQLLCALEEDKEPEISGRDNLGTMALVDACYKSIATHRAVSVGEIEKI